jgi:hypothetical protein
MKREEKERQAKNIRFLPILFAIHCLSCKWMAVSVVVHTVGSLMCLMLNGHINTHICVEWWHFDNPVWVSMRAWNCTLSATVCVCVMSMQRSWPVCGRSVWMGFYKTQTHTREGEEGQRGWTWEKCIHFSDYQYTVPFVFIVNEWTSIKFKIK